MQSQEFTLKTLLYVDPPEEDLNAVKYIREVCQFDELISKFNPQVRDTRIKGRIEVGFRFTAESPEQAEQIADSALEKLLNRVNAGTDPKKYREGSNLLSFA